MKQHSEKGEEVVDPVTLKYCHTGIVQLHRENCVLVDISAYRERSIFTLVLLESGRTRRNSLRYTM